MLYKATLQSELRSVTADGLRDKIAHTAQAIVSIRDDGDWNVRYFDPENHGETVLGGTPSRIFLRRSGLVDSRMTFEVSKMTDAFYRTPAGIIDISVRTHRFSCEYDAEGGRLTLDYDLHIAGEFVGKNSLMLRWKRNG